MVLEILKKETNMLETSNLLQTPVSKYIVFRFLKIESTSENTQEFSWLSFKEASSYIIELSNSEGIVFREKVAATNNIKETYSYEKAILQPGDDYLFTVEIDPDPQISFLDSYTVNNEESIAESVAQGRNQIKQLDLSEQAKVNLLEQLDFHLIARNEILNIIESIASQVNNSEIVGFLNKFLAQDTAFNLFKKANSADYVLIAISEIANHLAAAHITLDEYIDLLATKNLIFQNQFSKGIELAFFEHNLRESLQTQFMSRAFAGSNCSQVCDTLARKSKWSKVCQVDQCRGCRPCSNVNP